jgi:hypothetical protein
MSEYNKKFCVDLIINNKNELLKLKKFSSLNLLSSIDEFINCMKLSKDNIIKIENEIGENNIMNIQTNGIKLYNTNKIKKFYSKSELNTYKLPENIFKTSDPESYKGSMSFSSCFFKNENKIKDNFVSVNDVYFGTNFIQFPRITSYTNDYKLRLFNFTTFDYTGRIYYRNLVTKLILGDDYKFNLKNGFYNDSTLGQEVIYYLFEIYNYDMYNYINNIIENNKKDNHIVTYDDIMNNPIWSKELHICNGIIYYDSTNDSHNNKIDGIEICIFNIDITLSISDILLLESDPNSIDSITLDIYNIEELNKKFIELKNNYDLLKDVRFRYTSLIRKRIEQFLIQLSGSLCKKNIISGGFYNKYNKYKFKNLVHKVTFS